MSKVRSHHRPNIAIGPRKAASLALALLELATNVAKSGTSGAVYIEWTLGQADTIRFVGRRGGPEVAGRRAEKGSDCD
jgi:two-component sensor histidine kinase